MLNILLSISIAVSIILIAVIFSLSSKLEKCLKNNLILLRLCFLMFLVLLFVVILLYFKEPLFFLYAFIGLIVSMLCVGYLHISKLYYSEDNLFIKIGKHNEELEQIVFIKEQDINNLEQIVAVKELEIDKLNKKFNKMKKK